MKCCMHVVRIKEKDIRCIASKEKWRRPRARIRFLIYLKNNLVNQTFCVLCRLK